MSEDRYRRVAKFAVETPWAIMPETLRVIQDVLSARLAGERWSDSEIEARIEAAGGRRPHREPRQAGGVAVIPLSGVIMPRASLMTQLSGGTAVTDFQDAVLAAMADPDVGAVVLDVDSPGGSIDLVTEAAGRIRAVRGSKPLLAVADTLMASAAYWLAAQADDVAVTPSGLAGSVGVYATHVDQSALNEKLGVKPTLVSAGRFKTEGNPHAPLTDEAAGHLQSIVDQGYAQFTSDVAKGRRVTVDTVRGGYGEGRVLTAKDAVKAGVADRVATLEETISRAAELAQDGSAGRTAAMSVSFMASLDRAAGPIAPHSTPTVDKPYDGPAAEARIPNDAEAATLRRMYAWVDDAKDADTKAAYKFVHHETDDAGVIGAANIRGCRIGIAELNGARGGANIPNADREGVWDHLARHMRDGDQEPPPLKSHEETETEASGRAGASFAEAVEQVLCAADNLAAQPKGLSGPKREKLEQLRERLGLLLASPVADMEADTDPSAYLPAAIIAVGRARTTN